MSGRDAELSEGVREGVGESTVGDDSRRITMLAHEIRNSLQVATGNLRLARTESRDEHLDVVEHELERMNALLEQYVSPVRDGASLEPHPVDIATVSERCWRALRPARATLSIDTDQTVVADASRLEQLLYNLFSNAVEHGGDDVAIAVGAIDGGGFYVADDGPGIAEEDRVRAFDHGFTTAPDGTGVGLYVVRRVVLAHGWSIRISESRAGGAKFEITGVSRPRTRA